MTKLRYIIKEGSNSGHCCFRWSVMDTTRTEVVRPDGGTDFPYAVCECYEKEDAERIAAALNSAVEPEAPRCTCSTEIRVVSIDPECPKGHGKGLPPRPLTVPAEPTEERPSQPLESSTVCTACQRVKDDTGNTRGWGLCHCGSFRHPTAIHL